MPNINWEIPSKMTIGRVVRIVLALLLCAALTYMFLWENRIERKIDRIERQFDPVIDSPLPETQSPHPHSKSINEIESGAGMPLSRIAQLIIAEEGVRDQPYKDTRGIVTIGVGRSLQTNGITVSELFAIVDKPDLRYIIENTQVRNGRILIDSIDVANQIFSQPLDEHDLDLLLIDDLKNVMMEAIQVFGDECWHQIDVVRQEAILDILFNLGLPTFKKFVNFIDAVKVQDWNKASTELLLSQAAQQNYNRYRHISHVIDTGEEKYFYVD